MIQFIVIEESLFCISYLNASSALSNLFVDIVSSDGLSAGLLSEQP